MKKVMVTTRTYDNGMIVDHEQWEMNMPETQEELKQAVNITEIRYGDKIIWKKGEEHNG